jgi:hypothetical protein
MPRSRSDWPAAPDFHPEFGFLCLSPRRRRVLRLVMLSVATAVAIGATMRLAGAHWPDREAATAQPTDAPLAAAVSATGMDASRLHESCKPDGVRDLVALFFNSACGSGKLHARHGGRAPNRVATVIIGRTDAASTAATTQAPAAATGIETSHGDGAGAEKSAALTTAAVERTTPPKKPKLNAKVPIALTAQARELSRQNTVGDAAMAYAATPKIRRESFNPYGDTFRSSTPQSGFDAPFGRIR